MPSEGATPELIRLAAADGTATVVATPHVRTDFVTDGHDMVGRLSQQELDSIAQGPPDARWLLVEAPFTEDWAELHVATDELRDRGFAALIAHPERSADAQSLTGAHGPEAHEAAFRLVRVGLASVVSSDAHGATRPPLLGEARARLRHAGLDAAVCAGLTVRAPRRLLHRGIPARAAARV